MELITLPDERLFQKSVEVPQVNDAVRALVAEMFATMHRANGVGLAAVQIGSLQRIFVVHIENDEPRVFINPVLSAVSSNISVYEEGCLSIPGIYAEIERPDTVHIDAINENGDSFSLDAEGFLARVIFHEYDHLQGVLFHKHLSDRKQERFLRSYERNRKQSL
jgi:peptide deformylase